MKRWCLPLLLALLAGLFALPWIVTAQAPPPLEAMDGLSFAAPPLVGAAGMIVNQANLANLFVGFKAAFNTGFRGIQPMWLKVATLVPSSTAEEHYAWLGQWPKLREWLGDRHVKGLAAFDYTIRNKDYEATIAVKRPQIEDDTYGIFRPLFEEMGFAAAQHPDELVWALVAAGFATLGYDGQNFFDTDHPVKDGVASNTGGGAGTPWFLFDTRRPLKPLIFQKRKEYEFVSLNRPADENVFMRNEFVYGVDARCNVGYGFWQQAYGSKQTLDKDAYAAARTGMMSLKSDEGRPLGIVPNLLIVPPSLEKNGLEILNAERDAAGATNVWRNTAELLVVPHLA